VDLGEEPGEGFQENSLCLRWVIAVWNRVRRRKQGIFLDSSLHHSPMEQSQAKVFRKILPSFASISLWDNNYHSNTYVSEIYSSIINNKRKVYEMYPKAKFMFDKLAWNE